jgi:hypothetical protein
MIWRQALARLFEFGSRAAEEWEETDLPPMECGPGGGRFDLETFKGIGIHGDCERYNAQWQEWLMRGRALNTFFSYRDRKLSSLIYLPAVFRTWRGIFLRGGRLAESRESRGKMHRDRRKILRRGSRWPIEAEQLHYKEPNLA